MQFTLRQRQLLGLWVLVSVLCAVAGPFGTHEVMDLPTRGAYWAAIVALSIMGSLTISRIMPAGAVAQVAVWAGFAVVLSLIVYGVNTLLFPASGGGGVNLLYLMTTVGISVVVINGLLRLYFSSMPQTQSDDAPDPQLRFLRRLPIEARGPLVRIEAQDHYLNVVTTAGSALILLRLSEAVDELADVDGLQTHRSHWVRLDAVTGHRRLQGRDVLVMSDGAEVPVARTRRDAARAAGLF